MARVITLNRYFLKGHPKAGQPTYFPEKVWKALWQAQAPMFHSDFSEYGLTYDYFNKHMCELDAKIHTIRAGKRWKTGDMCSLRVWSGKPYNSKQIAIAPDFALPRVADIETNQFGFTWIDGKDYGNIQTTEQLSINDGLNPYDLSHWLHCKPFSGQILFFTDTKTPY